MYWHGIWAALAPLALFGIPARILDVRYGTSPWLLLAAIFLALHITLAILIWKFRRVFATPQDQKSEIKSQN